MKLDARSEIGKKFIDPLCDAALVGAAVLGLILSKDLPWYTFAVLAVVGLILFVTVLFAPRRISRITEGILPFFGIAVGLAVTVMISIKAFREYALWLLPIAIIVGPICLKIKRPRICEAIENIKQLKPLS